MIPRINAVTAFRVSAWFGFAGVALGAFGAHSLRDVLAQGAHLETWKTAVLYHLIHATVMLGLAGSRHFRPGPWLAFGAGVVLFSGSLYALAVGATHEVGIVTPLGGLFFLGGYVALAWQARSWVVGTDAP